MGGAHSTESQESQESQTVNKALKDADFPALLELFEKKSRSD